MWLSSGTSVGVGDETRRRNVGVGVADGLLVLVAGVVDAATEPLLSLASDHVGCQQQWRWGQRPPADPHPGRRRLRWLIPYARTRAWEHRLPLWCRQGGEGHPATGGHALRHGPHQWRSEPPTRHDTRSCHPGHVLQRYAGARSVHGIRPVLHEQGTPPFLPYPLPVWVNRGRRPVACVDTNAIWTIKPLCLSSLSSATNAVVVYRAITSSQRHCNGTWLVDYGPLAPTPVRAASTLTRRQRALSRE